AGFDGIAAAMAAGLERLDVFVELGPGETSESELLYEGTAREVALRFPDGVNVAVAAALAGPGLDAPPLRVLRPPGGARGPARGGGGFRGATPGGPVGPPARAARPPRRGRARRCREPDRHAARDRGGNRGAAPLTP